MYSDQTTQYQQGPAMGLIGGNTVAPASLLQSALNEQGEQLSKLHEFLGILAERLQPVSCPRPEPSGNETEQPEAVSSMILGQLRMQTLMVKGLQKQVARQLEELEI